MGDSSDGGEDGAELWHNQDKDYQNGVVVGVRRLKFVTMLEDQNFVLWSEMS